MVSCLQGSTPRSDNRGDFGNRSREDALVFRDAAGDGTRAEGSSPPLVEPSSTLLVSSTRAEVDCLPKGTWRVATKR